MLIVAECFGAFMVDYFSEVEGSTASKRQPQNKDLQHLPEPLPIRKNITRKQQPFLRAYERKPRGSIYTTIMELGPKRPSLSWLWGPNSIIVVYMDPLGKEEAALDL